MKKPNFYYVYIITNNILNKQYVGSRLCYKTKIEDDIYWGSSKYLKKDYDIYGKENFTKEILKLDCKDKNELLNEETNFIIKHNTLAPNGYNRFLPNQRKGFSMSGCKHSEESKQKMRGRKHTDEEKDLMKKNHKNFKGENHPQFGTHLSKDHKNKIRKKLSGTKLS